MLALEMGGQIGEIDRACRPLVPISATDDENSQELWYRSWRRMGDSRQELALRDKAAGHRLTAARKLMRAAIYLLIAERHLSNTRPEKLSCYRDALALFEHALNLSVIAVEIVEVPF